MPAFKDIVELLKQGSKPLVAISLSSLFILLATAPILEFFGGTAVLPDYRWVVGIFFLFSTVLLLVNLVTRIYEILRNVWNVKQKEKKWIDRLENLTSGERSVLNHYVSESTRTGYFQRNNGIVRGLEQESILQRVSDVNRGIGYPFNIAPWAYEYLLDHPELVEKIEADPKIYDSRAQS